MIENADFCPQRFRSSSFDTNKSFKEIFNDDEDIEIINVSPSSHENDKNDQAFDEVDSDSNSRPCARLGDNLDSEIVVASQIDSPVLGPSENLKDTRKSIENTSSSDESFEWPNNAKNNEKNGDEFQDEQDGQRENNGVDSGEDSKDTTQVC